MSSVSQKKKKKKKKMVHVEMRHFDLQVFNIFHSIYMVFKITKLALKYRLFDQICFCQSRDMFD